ncbi:MAG TPA: hypothetical protein VFK06_10660 [Candidatus Angelobacter sp.]|nr:hypothetical protein [Candidatus Angelobacter sp.]
MQKARPILVVLIAVVLAAYASDCSAMASSEQAMQCCQSMGMECASHGLSAMDCCSSMQSAQAPFVMPAASSHDSLATLLFFAVPASENQPAELSSSGELLTAQSHAPPIFNLSAPLPLRI